MNRSETNRALDRINPMPADPSPPSIAPLMEQLDTTVRAFGDPISLGLPSRERRVTRGRVALVGAAAGGAAIVVVALVGPSGGGTPDVLAAVARAATPGPGVLHMVEVTENTTAGQTNTIREELWSAQKPRRLRTITTIGGETYESALTTKPRVKLLSWSAGAPDVIEQSSPTGVLSSEVSPVSWLHEAYAKGELTLVGRSTLDGRAVWQLQVDPAGGTRTLNGKQLPDPTVLVDASTFVPLENVIDSVSTAGGQPELEVTRVRYLDYEELPGSPQEEALLELAQHPGVSVKSE